MLSYWKVVCPETAGTDIKEIKRISDDTSRHANGADGTIVKVFEPDLGILTLSLLSGIRRYR